MSERARVRIRVGGVVQGVGFRPYVHRLATELALGGCVGNDAIGVFIEAEGEPPAIDELLRRLPVEVPPLAVVEGMVAEPMAPTGSTAFHIAASAPGDRRSALVAPDVATCGACLAEIDDPDDRHHDYAFTSCTHCGPRFTIVRDVPYDRSRTTMADFTMCADCRREYDDPDDRRFHAEATCCSACGPRLRLVDNQGSHLAGDPVMAAAALLHSGRVVAVKGLGGYHLAVDAADEQAVATLRGQKHREEKPFAVLVRDLEMATRLCVVDPAGSAELRSGAAPIVLLPRRPEAPVAPSVAPGNRWLGLMLPSTPLHHQLARAHGAPLVLTSGNVSDEPISHLDDEALERLGGIADAFLSHDRPIHVRVDDSVVRVVAGRAVPVRRARGHVPRPVPLPLACPRPVLGVGAELKSTICLAERQRAFVSQHLGDLENAEVLRSWSEAIEHHQRLFDIRPEVVAHDLHPEYLSTKHAVELDGVELVAVQHHHAHIASCLADNGTDEPVIGVAFDGLGFGTDGTLWGGEILVADLADAERVGHLSPAPQPGGAAAVREPWRMAAAHLWAAFDGSPPAELDVAAQHPDDWQLVLQLCRSGMASPTTTSMGRLFDAVAAILGVRHRITYEGQAATELEQLADPAESAGYPLPLSGGTPLLIEAAPAVTAVVADLASGVPSATVAARFHNGVAAAVGQVCDEVRLRTGLATAALSGGVFQNALLAERTVADLESRGFLVLTHRQVPPNDGGISLGQVAVAAARDRRTAPG